MESASLNSDDDDIERKRPGASGSEDRKNSMGAVQMQTFKLSSEKGELIVLQKCILEEAFS